MSNNTGKIIQVIGPVLDVSFDGEGVTLPKIHEALKVKRESQSDLIVEVQQHIGENSVRVIAMDSTDGLRRGMEVVPTGSPIKMPKGDKIKGRLMNVVGEAIDGIGELDNSDGYPIHREAPKFDELSTESEAANEPAVTLTRTLFPSL